MKKLLWILIMAMCAASSYAVKFDDYFVDKTLRVDYIFAGNSNEQHIYLDELLQSDEWAGRRHNLDSLPLAGNGEIVMTDKASGKVIYRTSFSSLFQEWRTTEEATKVDKAFENTFLLPFPKAEAVVTITLKDVHQNVCCKLVHIVSPTDILIRNLGSLHPAEYRYIHKGGNPKKCIDVVIMAEGYTAAEMPLFYKDAAIACEAILNHEPFKSRKKDFNFVAVATPSAYSGVSVPINGKWISSAVDSHFSTFYSDRYLTTTHVKKIHDQLAGIPYEHIIILANTDVYGGGGIYNSYTLTTAHNPKFRPVVVHEFGHSFGGLADEYFYDDAYSETYPKDKEPWEQNLTTLVNFESKWKDMMPEGTPIPTAPVTDENEKFTRVGVYEGGGYVSKGVYRPCTECRMKINAAPSFCPVCQRAISRLIDFYTK